MTSRRLDPTDAIAGGLFILFGLVFGIQSLGLEIGTAFRMGPGYFPLVLSGLLVVFGLVVLAGAFKGAGDPIGPLAVRGMVFILLAPIAFGLTVRGAGFVPAVFLATLIATFATPKLPLGRRVVLALAVTVFSTAVFSYALGLPFRRFGPWLPL